MDKPRARLSAPTFRPLVFWPLVILAGLSLVAALGLRLATSMVEARLGAMAEGYGLTITVGAVHVPLLGGIALDGVEVRGAAEDGAESGPVLARLDRVETDLSLVSVLGGARRPSLVKLRGGEVNVFADEHGPRGIRRAPREREESTQTSAGGAIEVTVEDLRVTVDAALSAAAGDALLARVAKLAGDATTSDDAPPETWPAGVVLRTVVIEELAGAFGRDADRRWVGAVRGRAHARGEPSATAISANVALDGTIKLLADTPFRVAFDTAAGPMWLGAEGLELSGTSLSVSNASVGAGQSAVGVGRLRAEGAPAGSDTPAGQFSVGWLRSPSSVAVDDVFVRRGPQLLGVAKTVVTFAQGTDVALEPASLTASGIRIASTARGGTMRLAIASVGATFDGIVAKARDGDPLGGVRSVIVDTPEGTLAVPSTLLPTTRADAPPEEDPAPATADGAMPILPGDDAALLGASPTDTGVPTTPRGVALDRLFASVEPRLSALDAMMSGKVGSLAATVSRLNPEIRGARINVTDEQGTALFGLDKGAFSLKPAVGGGLTVAFESRLVRDGVEQGQFAVGADVDRNGRISGANLKLKGREVAGRLAGLVDHFDVQPNSEVDLDVTWSRPLSTESPHHVKGTFKFKHFTFEFWRISDRPIDNLEGAIDFDLSLDPARQRVVVDLPAIRVGKATVSLSADFSKPKALKPSFRVHMRMPRQDCGAAAASIPKALIPNLTDLRLRGDAWFDARLDLDLEKPRELTLKVEGDVDGCQVLSLAPDIDPARLRDRFVHHPREPERGVLEHIAVGRGTREWIVSDEIPAIVKLAAWVTEDRKWEDHGGVRWDLVASALKIDLDHGRFIYGGSTITQQLVKNLYLTRTKHLARKFEEAIIAWQMERVLTKDEILTTYINCIEYGPDVYGIRAAARHYFDKRPQDLDGLEASFIMGLKPYPKAGQRQFERGVLDKWWIRRVSYVLKLMAKYGPEIITLEEAEAFDPYQPNFRRP